MFITIIFIKFYLFYPIILKILKHLGAIQSNYINYIIILTGCIPLVLFSFMFSHFLTISCFVDMLITVKAVMMICSVFFNVFYNQYILSLFHFFTISGDNMLCQKSWSFKFIITKITLRMV